jgi:hypothetical protein
MLALAARTQQILSYAAFEGYTGIAIFAADHRVYSLTGNKMLFGFSAGHRHSVLQNQYR